MNEFIAACKKYFGYAMLFSMFINILQLTFSIYMLQVYDKVLTSYNISTLVVITIAAVVALVALALLEWIRSRLLIRAGVEFDRKLSFPVLDAELRSAAVLNRDAARGEIRDVQTLRSFLGSNAVFAFFDIPWMPIYFLLIFVLHPALGLTAVMGGLVVFAMGVVSQKIATPTLQEANKANRSAALLLACATRTACAITSMGMIGAVSARWHDLNSQVIRLQTSASRGVGLLHSISKSFRLGLQVLIYAVGAYLAVTHQTTAGVMIAASIIMGRALSPIDQAMGTYKQSLEAWGAYKKIQHTLNNSGNAAQRMELPKPHGALTAEGVSFSVQERPLLQGVSFRLKPGTALAIIGPSASGKSTLCKLLLGVWPLGGGKVRLDGADLASWDSEQLGKHLGYLPQEVELFAGTVAENIARMGPVEPEQVVQAARLAGVHDLVLRLPQGYDTPIGDFGQALSGGQRQRIGLARALYGNPQVIILDEPNSNLDEEGEIRLMQCLTHLRQTGTTIVLVAHKPSLLAAADEILAMQQGRVALYGPRDAVLQKMAEIRQKQQQTIARQMEKRKQQDVPAVLNGGEEAC